jgi:hypothetical protein|tara:strand:+ start:1856 stop:2056 length:201 start_codon:yes stop_codon:yes gene_type:complete
MIDDEEFPRIKVMWAGSHPDDKELVCSIKPEELSNYKLKKGEYFDLSNFNNLNNIVLLSEISKVNP